MQIFPWFWILQKKIKNRAQKREHRDTIFGTAEHEKINTQQR